MTDDTSQHLRSTTSLRGIVNPSQRLRDIAELARVPEVRTQLEALAVDFEDQHNQQNGQWTVVLGQIELHFQEITDALTKELDDAAARQWQMMQMLEQMQSDIRVLAAREVGDGG